MCCSDLIEWFVAQLSTRSVQWEWWVPRVQLFPQLTASCNCVRATCYVNRPVFHHQYLSERLRTRGGWKGAYCTPILACCAHPAHTSPYIPAQEPLLTPTDGLSRTRERCPRCFHLGRRKYGQVSDRNTRSYFNAKIWLVAPTLLVVLYFIQMSASAEFLHMDDSANRAPWTSIIKLERLKYYCELRYDVRWSG